MRTNLVSECTFTYESVLQRGKQTAAWVRALQRFGLTKLTGAPESAGQLSRLSATLSLPLRRTVYDENGRETFQVQVKPHANNQAYTAGELPLHTDLPFYEHPPAVQLLHCIKQNNGAGGASVFADGMAAAKAYESADQDGFKLLCNVPVRFEDIDPRPDCRYHLEATHPVLQCSENNAAGMGGCDGGGSGGGGRDLQCTAVHINNGVRSPALAEEMDQEDITQHLRQHYIALNAFRKILKSRDFLFEQQANPGDIWVFDNRRVLHGRRALTKDCRERHLEGGYIEWDDLRSLLRLSGPKQ